MSPRSRKPTRAAALGVTDDDYARMLGCGSARIGADRMVPPTTIHGEVGTLLIVPLVKVEQARDTLAGKHRRMTTTKERRWR